MKKTPYRRGLFGTIGGMAISSVLLMTVACASTAPSAHLPAAVQDDRPAVQKHWRVINVTADLDAPVGEVWNDWSTAEGQAKIFGAPVTLELHTNGLHEVWFAPDAPAGQRGHENGRIVGFQTNTMLAFTWTMPPYMPAIRPYHTYVQLFFESLDATHTRVFLYHTGFGTGSAWDEGHDYFAKIWPQILSRYTHSKASH